MPAPAPESVKINLYNIMKNQKIANSHSESRALPHHTFRSSNKTANLNNTSTLKRSKKTIFAHLLLNFLMLLFLSFQAQYVLTSRYR